MRELFAIRLVMPRNLLKALAAFAVLALSGLPCGSETMSVTLYYPAPVGAYHNLGVRDYLRVGPATSGTALFMGDLSASLGTDAYGIYVRSSSISITVNSCTNCSGADQKSAIWLMGLGGSGVEMPGNAAFANVCTWVAGSVTPIISNTHTMTLMSIGSGSTFSYTGTTGLWCRMSAVVKSTIGP